MDNFSSKFLFLSVGRQLATFAGILVAKMVAAWSAVLELLWVAQLVEW